MKGILWGVLGLALLDVLLNSQVNIPAAFEGVAGWLADWMSPDVPLLTQQAAPHTTSTNPTSPAPGQIQTLSTTGIPFPTSLPPMQGGGNVTTAPAGATIAIS